MTQTSFISQINWRLILVHLIATCLFIYSAQIAAYLFDIRLVDIIRQSSQEDVQTNLSDNGTTVSELFALSMRTGVAGFAGLVLASLMSLMISLKLGWSWPNSVISFALAYSLYKLNLLGSTYITSYLLHTTGFLNNTFLEFFIGGLLCLLAGLLVFFFGFTRKFIEKK